MFLIINQWHRVAPDSSQYTTICIIDGNMRPKKLSVTAPTNANNGPIFGTATARRTVSDLMTDIVGAVTWYLCLYEKLTISK